MACLLAGSSSPQVLMVQLRSPLQQAPALDQYAECSQNRASREALTGDIEILQIRTGISKSISRMS